LLFALALVAAIAVGASLTWYFWPNSKPVASYGGAWSVAFIPGTTRETEEAAITACASLTGVTGSGVTETGGYITGPPAGGTFSAARKELYDAQRVAILACLQSQPAVKSVVEGL
jgi:hypothetical protein